VGRPCYTCRYNPIKTTKTSFLGTMNMLGLAKRTNGKFILASTSEVYGDPLEHPQTEKYWGNVNPIGERSCYDEGDGPPSDARDERFQLP
jgi:UDP-glucuronate decarboxylase